MVVRYWSDFDQVVVVVAPEDETGWWSGVGRIASAVALASSVALVNSATRSEERRVGKECRSRWSPYH